MKAFGSFPFVTPQYVMRPQLQSTCHYILNYSVKILHVRLGGANNMRPLSWGGGGAQTEKIQAFIRGLSVFRSLIGCRFCMMTACF